MQLSPISSLSVLLLATTRDCSRLVAPCPPGFQPPDCQHHCAAGWYGLGCASVCPSTCSAPECRPDTGHCYKCRPGFRGAICGSKCKTGFFGKECAQKCSANCLKGLCDVFTGACPGCEPGFFGTSCNQEGPGLRAKSRDGVTQGFEDPDRFINEKSRREMDEAEREALYTTVIILCSLFPICLVGTCLYFMRGRIKEGYSKHLAKRRWRIVKDGFFSKLILQRPGTDYLGEMEQNLHKPPSIQERQVGKYSRHHSSNYSQEQNEILTSYGSNRIAKKIEVDRHRSSKLRNMKPRRGPITLEISESYHNVKDRVDNSQTAESISQWEEDIDRSVPVGHERGHGDGYNLKTESRTRRMYNFLRHKHKKPRTLATKIKNDIAENELKVEGSPVFDTPYFSYETSHSNEPSVLNNCSFEPESFVVPSSINLSGVACGINNSSENLRSTNLFVTKRKENERRKSRRNLSPPENLTYTLPYQKLGDVHEKIRSYSCSKDLTWVASDSSYASPYATPGDTYTLEQDTPVTDHIPSDVDQRLPLDKQLRAMPFQDEAGDNISRERYVTEAGVLPKSSMEKDTNKVRQPIILQDLKRTHKYFRPIAPTEPQNFAHDRDDSQFCDLSGLEVKPGIWAISADSCGIESETESHKEVLPTEKESFLKILRSKVAVVIKKIPRWRSKSSGAFGSDDGRSRSLFSLDVNQGMKRIRKGFQKIHGAPRLLWAKAFSDTYSDDGEEEDRETKSIELLEEIKTLLQGSTVPSSPFVDQAGLVEPLNIKSTARQPSSRLTRVSQSQTSILSKNLMAQNCSDGDNSDKFPENVRAIQSTTLCGDDLDTTEHPSEVKLNSVFSEHVQTGRRANKFVQVDVHVIKDSCTPYLCSQNDPGMGHLFLENPNKSLSREIHNENVDKIKIEGDNRQIITNSHQFSVSKLTDIGPNKSFTKPVGSSERSSVCEMEKRAKCVSERDTSIEKFEENKLYVHKDNRSKVSDIKKSLPVLKTNNQVQCKAELSYEEKQTNSPSQEEQKRSSHEGEQKRSLDQTAEKDTLEPSRRLMNLNVVPTQTIDCAPHLMSLDFDDYSQHASPTQNVDCTRQAPLSQHVDCTRQAPLSQHVDCTRQAPLSQHVDCTRQAPLSQHVDCTRQAPLSKHVDCTRQTPLSQHVDCTRHGHLSQNVDRIRQAPVSQCPLQGPPSRNDDCMQHTPMPKQMIKQELDAPKLINSEFLYKRLRCEKQIGHPKSPYLQEISWHSTSEKAIQTMPRIKSKKSSGRIETNENSSYVQVSSIFVEDFPNRGMINDPSHIDLLSKDYASKCSEIACGACSFTAETASGTDEGMIEVVPQKLMLCDKSLTNARNKDISNITCENVPKDRICLDLCHKQKTYQIRLTDDVEEDSTLETPSLLLNRDKLCLEMAEMPSQDTTMESSDTLCGSKEISCEHNGRRDMETAASLVAPEASVYPKYMEACVNKVFKQGLLDTHQGVILQEGPSSPRQQEQYADSKMINDSLQCRFPRAVSGDCEILPSLDTNIPLSPCVIDTERESKPMRRVENMFSRQSEPKYPIPSILEGALPLCDRKGLAVDKIGEIGFHCKAGNQTALASTVQSNVSKDSDEFASIEEPESERFYDALEPPVSSHSRPRIHLSPRRISTQQPHKAKTPLNENYDKSMSGKLRSKSPRHKGKKPSSVLRFATDGSTSSLSGKATPKARCRNVQASSSSKDSDSNPVVLQFAQPMLNERERTGKGFGVSNKKCEFRSREWCGRAFQEEAEYRDMSKQKKRHYGEIVLNAAVKSDSSNNSQEKELPREQTQAHVQHTDRTNNVKQEQSQHNKNQSRKVSRHESQDGRHGKQRKTYKGKATDANHSSLKKHK